MRLRRTVAGFALALCASISSADEAPPTPTREFEIRSDRPFLGGRPIDIWGIRCGNALYSPAVTERHINNLDDTRP